MPLAQPPEQVCCADKKGVWIGQMMYVAPTLATKLNCTNATAIKLPATMSLHEHAPGLGVLPYLPGAPKHVPIPFGRRPNTFQQVFWWQVRHCNMDSRLSQRCRGAHTSSSAAQRLGPATRLPV